MSTFINKVDAKGRVSVPVDFRNALKESQDDVVICFPAFVGECLEGAGQAYFDKINAYIDDRDPYDEIRIAFEVSIIGDSIRLTIDKDGRITLTESFFKHADIDEQVAFVGLGEKFQMWNPRLYDQHRAAARDLALQNRGLLKPKLIPQSAERRDRE